MTEEVARDDAMREAEHEGSAEGQLPWSVAEFFHGRDVLVTGGSGFVGRVLLEKLLFSCPDVGTIFVLVRPRKGLSPEERLQRFVDVPLFERVRAQRPGALKRLRAVAGDAARLGLGLAEEDARLLAERVSVIFHLAASVRFDDPLSAAVRSNLRATRDLLDLATRMHRLQALVHVSTTFCNVGKPVYEEKLYPAAADWRSILAVVDAMDAVDAEGIDQFPLRILTEKILGEYCNTYTFTKMLAEHALEAYADRLPIGIVRPSVVVATAKEPFPGWVDNFNGPMGLMVGAGKGIVHTGYSDPEKYIDYIPCDLLVKGLIISSCEVAMKGLGQPVVYQAAQSQLQRITQGRMIEIAYSAGAVLPFKETLYHPCGGITRSRLLFHVQFFFFHLLPALLIDAALSITGRKPMLVRLQRRIYTANMAIAWFIMRNWNFLNERFVGLEARLRPGDGDSFAFDLQAIHAESYFQNALHGTRLFLLNEPDSNVPQAMRSHHRKRLLHFTLKMLFYGTIFWIVLSRLYNLLFNVISTY